MIAPIATADVVQKPYEGMERLLQDPIDAVIAVGGNDDDLMDFCRRMRNHANPCWRSIARAEAMPRPIP